MTRRAIPQALFTEYEPKIREAFDREAALVRRLSSPGTDAAALRAEIDAAQQAIASLRGELVRQLVSMNQGF